MYLALHWACFHNNPTIINAIIDSIETIPSIAQLSDKETKIAEFFLAKNEDDYSAFHLAVYRGNIVI